MNHIVRKTTNPVSAPTEAGIHWINTTTGEEFFSVGTSNVTDWLARDNGQIPLGGTTGEYLKKASSTDYDTEWAGIEVPYLESTGIRTGGVLSIGTGGAGVATTFTIAAGTGQVVDNSTTPPTVTQVSWSQKTDVAITNLATSAISYIAIDVNGNVQQSTTDWTPSQMRQYIEIGLVSHPDLATVSAVNQMHVVTYNPINQIADLLYGLGNFNVSGNVFSANGANLKLSKSSGFIMAAGANYSSPSNNPHIVTTGSLSAPTFRTVNRSGAASAPSSDVDVANYDNAGVTTAIPVNKFTIHRIYLFTSNFLSVQRGQNLYNSLAEAKAAIQVENYVTNPGFANGVLRAYLITKQGTTSLQNASDAAFLEAPKFGGTAGVGGLSVSTLQNVYDNSSDPEVVTDSTRGAVSIKRGSAADTDNIFEGLNGAGSVTSFIKGDGTASFAKNADVQVFSSSGTWTKPTGAKVVEVYCAGAGGGGGSGRRAGTGTVRCGGGGGAGGVVSRMTFLASELASSETVTVGAGGTGGTGRTTDGDGNNGLAGGNTTFGTWLKGLGGSGGSGGTSSTSTGASALITVSGYVSYAQRGGGSGSATGGNAGNAGTGDTTPMGGAAGGGVTSGDVAGNGGSGGNLTSQVSDKFNLAGGTGGTGAGSSGGNGNSAAFYFGRSIGTGGGGGAGGVSVNSGAGGNGGACAGGGGAGAVQTGFNGGNGGNGGDGWCVVVTYF